VRHAGSQLAHRGQLLGVDELGLRAAQLVELSRRLGVEPGFFIRDVDMVLRLLQLCFLYVV
jgi:hypothetical protein